MLKQYLFGFTLVAIAAGVIGMGNAAEPGYAPQVSNERQVKITATLQNITKEAKTWDIEVSLETHTHALSEFLENTSMLIADGKQYKPMGWEGSPPGGHHRKGVLRFKAIDPQPASVELQIRLIGDPSPRSFQWILKGASNGN
jgi:hypothetical protein